jgi:hypothetical protein
MSAGHDDGSSLVSIGLGAILPGAIMGALGMFTAVATWDPVPDSAFSTFFAGICVGAISGTLVAWCMAWHASVVGVLSDKPQSAMLWGIIPGALFGATLGPLFAGVVGLFFGQLVSAAIFGLTFGALAGVMGWEIGYFVANFLHPHDDHAHGH